jgi:hypothetical protein
MWSVRSFWNLAAWLMRVSTSDGNPKETSLPDDSPESASSLKDESNLSILERRLWLNPSVLNAACPEVGAPGEVLFLVSQDRFLVSDLTLHTDYRSLLHSVLEAVVYCWCEFLRAHTGCTPGRIEGEGWPFGIDQFCRILSESSGVPVRSLTTGESFSPTYRSALYRKAAERWQEAYTEMAGCFSILADIEKNTG